MDALPGCESAACLTVRVSLIRIKPAADNQGKNLDHSIGSSIIRIFGGSTTL
jgi:hypothetical protein